MHKEIRLPKYSMADDAELVKAFQAGDMESFDELVLRHKDSLFNLCFRFFGDQQEANDSAQDVFIKVYGSLKKFRLESSFSTWLYRIAVNTCKNRLKSLDYRIKKRMKRLDQQGNTHSDNPSPDMIDESSSPMIELEKRERSYLVRQAIDSLPGSRKMMVILRDIEGLPYEEIAEITGYNLGTVKSRLARARSDLRNRLRGVF